jgi:hypothetical protein
MGHPAVQIIESLAKRLLSSSQKLPCTNYKGATTEFSGVQIIPIEDTATTYNGSLDHYRRLQPNRSFGAHRMHLRTSPSVEDRGPLRLDDLESSFSSSLGH